MTGSTWTTVQRGLRAFILLSLAIGWMTGCGSSQQETVAKDQLERARTAYNQAKANPNVETYAPGPMLNATKAIQAAEQAKKYGEMEQLSYLAEKKSQIAVTIAEGKKAERDTEILSKETAEILLQKREQETRLAQKEAEQAKLLALAKTAEAEQAKLDAEARAREVEMASRQAEAKARDAEKSRLMAEARARDAEQARLVAIAEAARAEKARAEAAQLMKELSDLKAQQTERGIVLTIGDVLFAVGKATLSPEANRSVDKLAEFLEKNPNRGVLIEGHTDNTGSDALNMALSQNRADAVKDPLVAKGIDPSRITTRGYGKKYPVATNDTAAGRQQNRRVEVIILNEGVKAETQFRE
jgi:outer membrane protein OmpA-like peptidoglycan-associated protein